MKLTPHFALEEFAVSNEYPELASRIDFTDYDINKLKQISIMLEYAREEVGNLSIRILSGKRTLDLNKKIGGSSRSEHLFLYDTAAVDFDFFGKTVLFSAFETLRTNTLYGQLILYKDSTGMNDRFIHMSLPTYGKYKRSYFNISGKMMQI